MIAFSVGLCIGGNTNGITNKPTASFYEFHMQKMSLFQHSTEIQIDYYYVWSLLLHLVIGILIPNSKYVKL